MHRKYTYLLITLVLLVTFQLCFSNNGLQATTEANGPAGDRLHVATRDAASTSVETTVPGGQVVNGFSLLDRLYLKEGTFYIVTSNISAFPPTRSMIARPLDIVEEMISSLRNGCQLQFIAPDEAEEILGGHALVIRGVSWIVYDTEQFMRRFYNWWGEIILGAWRVHSSLMSTTFSGPSRVMLPHILYNEWKDLLGLNAGLMRAAFPSTNIDKFDHWDDMVRLRKTFVFERAMIISRTAAHTHDLYKLWRTMISSTMAIDVPSTFWEPIRQTAVQNILGYFPQLNKRGVVVAPPSAVSEMPFVTYVVRQGDSRRLAELDHEALVEALGGLEQDGIYQVHVIQVDDKSLEEQVEVASRSTILVGVHGNGLTHQLWMPPSSRSTVIEIFAPESYVHEHEILAKSLGHKHYAVWNDTVTTFSDETQFKGVRYTDDFHSLSLPVHGPAIAQLIKQRLA